MQIRLRTLTLRIDWLALLFPLTAMLLGDAGFVALLTLSLAAHEFAHWLAALALHVGMPSIRLTPFGGMARIENPYGVPPSRLCIVAAAGPLANLLIVLVAAALCHWLPSLSFIIIEAMQINLLLMLFNLTPALPLDGGRILYALLSCKVRASTALRICLLTGRILAACLGMLALTGLILHGKLNLSFLFAAVFILASAPDERCALSDSRIQTLTERLKPITAPTRADLIAIDADTPPRTALLAARPHSPALFAVYRDGKLSEIIDDRTLIRKIIDHPPIP